MEALQFIGLVNYYRDMWERRSHMIATLTKLTYSKVKFKWTKIELQTFEEIKRIVAHNILSSYLDFDQELQIHTQASDFQLGLVISQEGRMVGFYSRKLSYTKMRHIIPEKEMLSIVEN